MFVDDEEAGLRKAREQELQVRVALKAILEDAAFQRLSLMRVSNESLYGQVVSYLFSLYTSGKIRGKISEEQLKSIAAMFISQKKETKIFRMHK